MRRYAAEQRIAVTGLGIVCAIGRDQNQVWDSIMASKDGITALSKFPGESFPTTIAAEVTEEVESLTGLTAREIRRMSRSDLFAVAAAREALVQAGSLPLESTLVSSGSSTGGLLEGESFYLQRRSKGRLRTAVSSVLQQPTSGPSDAIAKAFALGGGVLSNATACASAGAAIGVAADAIRNGRVKAAIAGGTDSLCRLTYSGFNVLQAVDAEPCTPFDANRKGITLGEGAGYIVIERWEDAVERGATILAELGAYGASCDAHHPTAPAEDGHGAAAAMSYAIRDSGLTAESIDYVNAHGTGTLLNDSAETKAITSLFGNRLPVSSSKSFFGHTLGAAGGVEAVISILALLRQTAPPTLRHQSGGEECTLDYIAGNARALPMRAVLSNTFGFGGSNVSLLFMAADR